MSTVNTIDSSITTTGPGDHGYDGFVEVLDSVIVNPGITIAAGGAGAHGIFSSVAGSQVVVGSGSFITSTQGIGIALTGLYNGHLGAGAVGVESNATVAGAQFGVTLDGSQNQILNSGAIRGATGARIGSNLAAGNIIRQSASGSIIGTGANSTGIDIVGDALVENAGLIQGEDFGISVRLGKAFTLVNDGIIKGVTAINVGSSGVASTILNYGRIEGIINLGNQNDVYEGRGGSVTGTVYMGGGNDKFFGGAGTEAIDPGLGNDTIDGGGGADVVLFQGNRANYTIVSNPDRSFTITSLAGETDVLRNVRSVQFADTAVFALGFDLVGTSGGNTLVGGWGNDTMNGEGGNDTLVQQVGDGNDYLIGSSGIDTVGFSGTAGAIISLARTSAQTTAYGSDIYSGIENLSGGSGNDRFTGTTLANVLKGNNGNDMLDGGYGKDVLYGGVGKDIFVFTSKPSSSNYDRIADYNVSDDSIQLDNRYLTKLGSGSVSSPKKLASSAFWKGSKAHDSSDRIIYDSAKGYLYYDADGTGASKQVLIATMSKTLKMTNAEFYVI